jgi:hypothetical protein
MWGPQIPHIIFVEPQTLGHGTWHHNAIEMRWNIPMEIDSDAILNC